MKGKKRIIIFLLVFVLAVSSTVPAVFATDSNVRPGNTSQPTSNDGLGGSESVIIVSPTPGEADGSPTPDATPVQSATPEPSPDPGSSSTPEKETTETPRPTATQTPEPSLVPEDEPEEVSPRDGTTVATVYYHYYDDTSAEGAQSPDDLALTATGSFYALAEKQGAGIAMKINHYPKQVVVRPDSLHFRVLIDGDIDATEEAEYNASTGVLALPANYAGHEISIHAYCPGSEAVDLTVVANIDTGNNNRHTTSTQTIQVRSDAGSFSLPLTGQYTTVSQNGVEYVEDSRTNHSNGTLTVYASPIGGNIGVATYIAPIQMLRSSISQTVDKIYNNRTYDGSGPKGQLDYGYLGARFEAQIIFSDGTRGPVNSAFCLDPTQKGLKDGNYAVSRWLDRSNSTELSLMKCMYYLWGGMAWDESILTDVFGSLNYEHLYGYSHVITASFYVGDDAYKGLKDDVISKLRNLKSTINSKPAPPSGFEAFIYNEGSSQAQAVIGWIYTAPKTGNAKVQKVSSNPAISNNNPCYSLAGAVFEVYTSDGQKVGTMTTGADGTATMNDLDIGSYYLVETKAPQGFAIVSGKINFTVEGDKTTTIRVPNMPQNDPVGIVVRKVDATTGNESAQGGALLSDAQFTVKYYAGSYTSLSQLNGVAPTRTWILKTNERGRADLTKDSFVSGDDFYYNLTNIPVVPAGTLTIQETKAPTGYLADTTVYLRQVPSDTSGMEDINVYNEPVVREQVIRGGVKVAKLDHETGSDTPQGNATLSGAVFDIYNRNDGAVTVGGKSYAKDTVVCTLTTGEDGTAATANNLLPYGDYEIVERTPPTGYTGDGVVNRTFSIEENGVIVDLTDADHTIRNEVIRGGVKVAKRDNETGKLEPQGDATLSGAVFAIYNRSQHPVLVDGELYENGEIVHTLTTGADYTATTSADLLPYGTYEIREQTSPTGYLPEGELNRVFSIREDGVIVDMTGENEAIRNDVIRGDLMGVKVADGSLNRLANVPFRLTLNATGESHVLMTDENGQFSTASSWNPHSQNTNRGESPLDGVWFGDMDALDDSKGALPYGRYTLEELPCEANEGMELLKFTVSVYRNNVLVDLGTLTDDYIPVPEISTTAKDMETLDRTAHTSATTVIEDTVYYNELTPGTTYTLKGVLMLKSTGEPLLDADGNPITAETEFKALATTGSVNMRFTFDSSLLSGESVVVFERLYEGVVEVAAHADIEDEGQTVTFLTPALETTATDKNGEKEVEVSRDVILTDIVSFDNLLVNQLYTIEGILMDKATGEPITVDGQTVESQVSFIVKKPSGWVEMQYRLDASELYGKDVVVFATLNFAGREVAAHADINDEGQTVRFVRYELETTATGEEGEKLIEPEKEVTVVDIVTYTGLIPGREYTVKGELMDKSTEKPLVVNGEEVRSEITFVPQESDGTVEMRFTFDASALQGTEVVVFERLYRNGKEVAAHADIHDEGQTVEFGGIALKTSATGSDGAKKIGLSEKASIVDVVSYTNLTVGREYTVHGILMDKATGRPIVIDGKEVRGSTLFTPTESDGTVEVLYTFDSNAVEGKTLVVYEYLEYDGETIASHEDINDIAQSVGVKVPPQPGDSPATGRDAFPVWALVVSVAAVSGAAVLFVLWNRKRLLTGGDNK